MILNFLFLSEESQNKLLFFIFGQNLENLPISRNILINNYWNKNFNIKVDKLGTFDARL